MRSIHTEVEQGRQPPGNPDALLFVVGVPGTGAVDPRYGAGQGELNGSVWRRGAARPIAHERRSRWRNRRYRGRSDDRQ